MDLDENLEESVQGKRVISADGDEIGVVSGVRNGTAFVDPDPGITEKIQSMLNWDEIEEDDYPLPDGAIERVEEDEVVLRREF